MRPATSVVLTIVVLAAAAVAAAEPRELADTTGPDGRPGGGSPGETTDRRDDPNDRIEADDTRGERAQRRTPRVAPVIAWGRVFLDDGRPLAEPALIVRSCPGGVAAETVTDTHGRFSVALGTNPATRFDPATPRWLLSTGFEPGADPTGLGGCSIEARVPGYRSESVELLPTLVADGDVRADLVLHRRDDVPGDGLSASAASAPPGARRAYARAVGAHRRGELELAVERYERALRRDPEYTLAWSGLGLARLEGGDADGARRAFLRAIELEPDYVWPYAGLAATAVSRADAGAAAVWTTRLEALAPPIEPVRASR